MFTSLCLKAWTVRYSASFHLFSIREACDLCDSCVCCGFEEPAILLSVMCKEAALNELFFWGGQQRLRAWKPFCQLQWALFVGSGLQNTGMWVHVSIATVVAVVMEVAKLNTWKTFPLACWSHSTATGHCSSCVFSSALSYVSYLEDLNEWNKLKSRRISSDFAISLK